MGGLLTDYPFSPAADAPPPAGVPVLARTPHGTPVARWDGAAWRSDAWAAGTMPRAYVLAWMVLPGAGAESEVADVMG
jgi:hypothetical protein